MSAATAMRVKTERRTSNPQSAPMLTNVEIFAGTIVMLNSSGLARPGATATGCIGVGVAKTRGGLPSWDNNPGDSSAITVEYEEGVFGPFDNSGTSIAAGDEGKPCYIVDDQTVHRTSNSGARSPAGRIHSVTSAGVYVDFSANIARGIAATAALAVLTDSSGGTANDTIAAITNAANAGSADVTPVANAIADLAAKVNAIIAALV